MFRQPKSIPTLWVWVVSVVIFGTIIAGGTQAATVVSDRTTFSASITAVANIDFAADATGGATSYNTAVGLSHSNVQFVGTSHGGFALAVIRPDFHPFYSGWTGNPTVLIGPYDGLIQITLPPGVTAVGFDIYSVSGTQLNPYGADAFITLSSNESFTVPTSGKPGITFAGIISDTPIDSLTVRMLSGVHNPCLSNFTYGTATAVPLPAAAWGGLALIGGLALRRFRSARRLNA